MKGSRFPMNAILIYCKSPLQQPLQDNKSDLAIKTKLVNSKVLKIAKADKR